MDTTQLKRIPLFSDASDEELKKVAAFAEAREVDQGKELVKVEVNAAWTMTLGGRSRNEQTTNILSNGSKK